jgi:hypothetical protein
MLGSRTRYSSRPSNASFRTVLWNSLHALDEIDSVVTSQDMFAKMKPPLWHKPILGRRYQAARETAVQRPQRYGFCGVIHIQGSSMIGLMRWKPLCPSLPTMVVDTTLVVFVLISVFSVVFFTPLRSILRRPHAGILVWPRRSGHSARRV